MLVHFGVVWDGGKRSFLKALKKDEGIQPLAPTSTASTSTVQSGSQMEAISVLYLSVFLMFQVEIFSSKGAVNSRMTQVFVCLEMRKPSGLSAVVAISCGKT